MFCEGEDYIFSLVELFGESDLDNKFSDWQWLIEVLNKCPKNDIVEFGAHLISPTHIYLPWNKGSLFIDINLHQDFCFCTIAKEWIDDLNLVAANYAALWLWL